jgi:hypothetical protein
MDKVECKICTTRFSTKYMTLQSGTYYCNCGYAINANYYKGDSQIGKMSGNNA